NFYKICSSTAFFGYKFAEYKFSNYLLAMRKSIFALLVISFISCKQESVQRSSSPNTVDKEKKAMIVSAREEASQIGIDIMKNGGNAFDAMVATDLALAVSFPFAGNIGGGGFMVYRLNNGEVGSLDYREK